MELSKVDALITSLCIASSLFLCLLAQWREYPTLKVEHIFIYPVKSLPPIRVQSARIDSKGFEFDRRFMLVSPLPDGTLKNHLISSNPLNSLITPEIVGDSLLLTASDGSTFSVSLNPSIDDLAPVEINMHNSKTTGHDVGKEAAVFFSNACAVATSMVYLNPKAPRPVLGSISQGKDKGIAFNDHGSFMVASSVSLNALSTTLGRPMDIIPLRPNIVLGPSWSLSPIQPWAEDFWSELKFGTKVSMRLTSNCVRCVSLNIDYKKGEFMQGTNLPLQALAKDRRVDTGSHSPVFGRYGFVDQGEGELISVGEEVSVIRKDKFRTTFDWPY